MDKDEHHLAIPILYCVDVIHGSALGAMVFPHNIGLGAAGRPDLIEWIGRVTALEVRAAGVDWTFAPRLAVACDPQWGRTYESYSENLALVARYVHRIVKRLQGTCNGTKPDHLDPNSVVACAKHWVGEGGTLAGVDRDDTLADGEELCRSTLPPTSRLWKPVSPRSWCL